MEWHYLRREAKTELRLNRNGMLKTLLFTLLLVGLAFVLLGVRVLLGRRFVHTHLDGNQALNRMGITCVKDMERQERRANPHAVKEKT